MRPIVMYPNEVLRKKVPAVKSVAEILTDVADLKEVLETSENGAGLASTQLGIEKRFFGLKNGKKVIVLINPQILGVYGQKVYPVMVGDKDEKEQDFLEGCLSFPDLYGTVKRYLKIEAVWQEIEKGKLVDKKKMLNGFEAIVFQHELDHLDGILFIDHIKRDGGKFYKFIGDKKIEWSIDKVVGEEK